MWNGTGPPNKVLGAVEFGSRESGKDPMGTARALPEELIEGPVVYVDKGLEFGVVPRWVLAWPKECNMAMFVQNA